MGAVIAAGVSVGVLAWALFTAKANFTFGVAPADMEITGAWNCVVTGPGACALTPTNGDVAIALTGLQSNSAVNVTGTFKNVSSGPRCGSITAPAPQAGMQQDFHSGEVAGPIAPNAFVSPIFDLHFVGLTPSSTLTPIEVIVTWIGC